MTRKGARVIFKCALPVLLPPERTAPKPAEFSFKGNCRGFVDPPPLHPGPPEASPSPPPPTLSSEEFRHQQWLSKVEASISTVTGKMTDCRKHPDMSPSEMKNLSRKLGRDRKYLESIKATLTDIDNDPKDLELNSGDEREANSSIEEELKSNNEQEGEGHPISRAV